MKRGILSYLFGGAILIYIGWIVFAGSATQRIERGCQPVNWAGNIAVSLVAFVEPSWEAGTKHAFSRGNYVCRYTIWRLIYGDRWQKAHPNQKLPAVPPKKSQKSEA